ncbi:MAG: NUDIX hydrolase [Candidatus Nomurabacteria bacterium GW2011_GWF2_40_31]|uniref:Bis(5'-nucleosyl)-tetraphosphatase [asymmetrical] n=2 Tax=Candidatus Nomuraibacteriota TaxID=1752729 RepID=A0A837HUU1_9BACT|nr:MAG: NUDIX hydrolase [Candidatus Nomurabacteria bacterium GW2011_GWD2_39_12]KKR20716.1 MAG: NUDIX hydrolase [Candidatus Nomurabacteria bacterium GW2011_GWC2_39_41]KKR37356.1 MAG: NUDIX hydrolase [Candidatus Nomurabacteria bacterium GW2011_GWE2_40_10]KKR38603.1 MAG: NUDIX hydrolase [Candidatus Nomurabacteria bacterium GW2011_GWB1_40_11]KKR40328.1 MAG: NUDIX hydrolase [Parcubacteria group bacterium GW2011_GWC1_40_11]KKR59563.1 MAG: NUDIX hydrolase [Candidatus Nomurabacteria bacterium GW2011_G
MRNMETKKEQSFGVIPVFKENNNFLFCLIHEAEGHWGFPKGHQDAGESEEETAKRELQEETGINNVILDKKSFIEKYSFERASIQYNKSAKYFIGFVSSITATTPENFKKEILELRWVNYNEAKQLLTFPEAREVLNQAFEYLKTEFS